MIPSVCVRALIKSETAAKPNEAPLPPRFSPLPPPLGCGGKIRKSSPSIVAVFCRMRFRTIFPETVSLKPEDFWGIEGSDSKGNARHLRMPGIINFQAIG